MKRIILYCVFCLSGLLTFERSQADEWKVSIDESFCDNAPDGFYPDYSDCRFFYLCYNYNTIHSQCPVGLVFDVPSGSCKFRNLSIVAASYCP